MVWNEYLAALRRRWPYMLASILIICGAMAVQVVRNPPPPQFQATASIIVGDNQAKVSADEVAEIALSRDVILPAIDELRRTGYRIQGEQDVYKLVRNLTVEAPGQGTQRSTIVRVTARAEDPGDAAKIATEIARQANISAFGQTQIGTLKTQEQQKEFLNKAQKELEEARNERQQFLTNHQDLIIPLDFESAKRAVYDLEQERRRAEIAVNDSQARASVLRRELGTRTAGKLKADAVPSAAVVERLQSDLVAREMELLNDKLRYTDEHPRVKQNQAAIDNLKKRLDAEYKKSFSLDNAPTSLEYQFILGDISRQESERVAASSRLNAIDSVLSRARQQLARVPELETEISKIDTRYQKAMEEVAQYQAAIRDAELVLSITKAQQEVNEGIGRLIPAQWGNRTAASRLYSREGFMFMALVISIILGMGMVMLLDSLDQSIRNVDEVEDRYQLPVLGVIPALKDAELKDGSTLVLQDAPNSPLSDCYRIMRSNYLALASHTGARSILITSTLPGEGKSTTAANFATSLAEGHKKVFLIDADLRNPTLHKIFKTRKEPGLSNYLSGAAELEDVIFPTETDNLFLISAGSIPDNPTRLLTGPRMRELLDHLKANHADYVIVDSPPAVAFSDAMDLGSILDSMVIVVGAGSRLESAHFRARSHLANLPATLVGTVLNRVQTMEVDSYRYSSRYYPKLDGSNGKSSKRPALPSKKTEEV